MTELVVQQVTPASEVPGESNIINKILGEMKSQFNKADKKIEPGILEFSENVDDLPEILRQSDYEDIKPNSLKMEDVAQISSENKTDSTTKGAKSNNSPSSNSSKKIKSEPEKEDEDDQPRIVMLFRKPTNSPNKSKKAANTKKRNLRSKSLDEKSNNGIVKRSARRSSRDCSESILQSAIARKEKSYNESNKPQRLTRQVKPTQKVLDNIANASALKLEKMKERIKVVKNNDKQKSNNESLTDDRKMTENKDISNGKGAKKHKLQENKPGKKNVKKSKLIAMDSDSSDFTQDQECSEEQSLIKRRSSVEKNSRRSHRTASNRSKEDDNHSTKASTEPSVERPPSCNQPSKIEFPEASQELIASRLCLCTKVTNLYFSNDSNKGPTFCQALDSLSDRTVGCNNVIKPSEAFLVRPSQRVPYMALCDIHKNRLLRHNCCPTCGLFCTQGSFVKCENNHVYHKDCHLNVGEMECCPHCGQSAPKINVLISMHSSKNPVFLNVQRAQFPPAKMSFKAIDLKEKELEKNRCLSPILLSPDIIELQQLLEEQSFEDESFTITDIVESIRLSNLEKFTAILATDTVDLKQPVEELNGGTILHFAATLGCLPAVHLLRMAQMDLDILDNEQHTPLMLAITECKNEVVQYLIKSGSNIYLKGLDGMTPLHLAAKSGNIQSCRYLLNAAFEMPDYINAQDDGGWTALVWASEHGHLEVAKYLILKGANVFLCDVEQNSALHWASFSGSSSLAEILLNSGCDVNCVNAHGETPLHIAARQNSYNCAILLMARGASVAVTNKLDETPLDCAGPGDTKNAIALNVQFLGIASLYEKDFPIILTNDISNGKEKNPIQCINEVDDTEIPSDYIYTTQNCFTSDIQIDRKVTNLQRCSCDDKCMTSNCKCINNSLSTWFDEDGRLIPNFNFADPPMLFECNEMCSCNKIICRNRVLQRGVVHRFQLFRTKHKGWGIKTLKPIPRGSFVCEYIGEIIADFELEQRNDDCYIFDLDSQSEESFSIDAKNYGNFARFINHSCDANLVPVKLFVEHHDLRFPRIAFFASRDIEKHEELSFDYGEKFWFVKYKSFSCLCQSSNCKFSEETIISTFETYNKRLQDSVSQSNVDV